MKIFLTNIMIILPAGIPGYECPSNVEASVKSGENGIGRCLVLSISELQVFLRLHDFFMG